MQAIIYKKGPEQPSAQGETIAVPASPERVTHYEPGSFIRQKKCGKVCTCFEKFLKWCHHLASEVEKDSEVRVRVENKNRKGYQSTVCPHE